MAITNGTICLLLLIFILEGSYCNTRYFVKMRTNASELFKTKNENLRIPQEPIAMTQGPLSDETRDDQRSNDERMIRDALTLEYDRRNTFETSTFNPDVLNKFLEDYANKIKSSTEKDFKLPLKFSKPTVDPLILEVDESTTDSFTTILDDEKSTLDPINSTLNEDKLSEILNDTLKRNKYYGMNSHDDRNGWVTLDAIPWSKSKISKWQANPSTQRPWPEIKPWEKPSMAKPWTSDYSSRPTYENNKPWHEKPKPYWQENGNEKPWQKPSSSSRPSYYPDKYDQVSNQAQKWPPEKPSWDKYPSNIHRPTDIITDDRPTNFPNTWNNRPQSSRPHPFLDRYPESNHADETNNDWHDFPPRTESLDRPRPSDRPNFSHYQYGNNHPSSHPSNGDGQWVLLSTNRGYSKSRQRSIKIDTLTPELVKLLNGNKTKSSNKENVDPTIAVMTSKRQVRLTVLPSINGTNTTTSHGGLLEVERTFKSVDQSRKEYERDRATTLPTILKKRPIRNTLNGGGQVSSSAVLAAVGAGMLPATMAMMIPMMLGRKKRDLTLKEDTLRKFHSLGINLHNLGKKYEGSKKRYF
ncbi:uncharacterized protein LOC118450225 isoform X1 [Vespa mandarinia]|uniref:uncharacterized protein LOC118450225 isoform X1 n=1 Tax=Vespa mandarinia TaxID=7446 RepID=UPI001613D88F|nr:uncharacterized protein LOC118450225 isoform X1 [Vespa mandarinia]XP_035741683.1 uncharacterized protein LOC118450225 isoform X1 [Vespa mandarinia]XP_035741684.1 uncharacterized protein LOC118450225 isoform X1 [Vespa mandarinia]XP_035741685.1 uncharacterized protein LOC118450225 isoform X1 [Vespa mandarinia]XP_035741686.1 uncharacterized protein LOC118450225 isoform X1 [Vespa mandarinia]XP_035741687.1 uncharacterized protein LOC118450225 isoform X1 [Vespa mandarinia]XP_035741688.1 uncharac